MKTLFQRKFSGIAVNSLWMTLLTITFQALSLLISILLARLMGAAGYGTYVFVITWIGLLSVPTVLGMDGIIVRKIAEYSNRSDWDLLKGILRRIHHVALISSFLLVVLAMVVSSFLVSTDTAYLVSMFWLSLILLPIHAFRRIRQAVMRAFQHTLLGQVPEQLIQPLLIILLVVSLYFGFHIDITVERALLINALSAASVLLLGMIMMRRVIPGNVKQASPGYEMSDWLRSALPLLLVSVLNVVNTNADILMLGSIKGTEEVGIYSIAKRASALVYMFMAAVNLIWAPSVAALYAKGDIVELQNMVTRFTRLATCIAVMICGGLVVFSGWFLPFFGNEFIEGRVALVILCAGQLINVAMGSVALLLILTGNERYTVRGVAIGVAVNVALNAVFIPYWGINGAAVATFISIVVWNFVLNRYLLQRSGIRAPVFG